MIRTYVHTYKSKCLQYTQQGILCIQLYKIHDEYVAIPVHTHMCIGIQNTLHVVT